ncbi:MAG TPA: PaaI family thioesterase [Chloroflexota bacterium]|nr:PaaI family thioesterase [Chloroflexota bacterium]
MDDASLREQSGEAYRRCFGCGTENPIGLHLTFRRAEDGARAEFRPRPEYQGWDGVLHGGIILTLLDETLGYTTMFAAGPTVTAALNVRFRRPAPLDADYTLHGQVLDQRHGVLRARATVSDQDGQVIAEAEGKFMPLKTGDGSLG